MQLDARPEHWAKSPTALVVALVVALVAALLVEGARPNATPMPPPCWAACHLLLLLLPVAARGDEPAAGGGARARGRLWRRGYLLVEESGIVNRLQNHIEMTMTMTFSQNEYRFIHGL